MNALTPFNTVGLYRSPFRDSKKSVLIRRGVCKDCTDRQYEEFAHVAETRQLDPLLKEIYCTFDEQGNMIPVVGIAGYRRIAVSAGDYMASDKEPLYKRNKALIDEKAKFSANPRGLVSCTVWVKKRDQAGVYHEVSGRVVWDEYAPRIPVMEQGDDGFWSDTGQWHLDKGNAWYRMPEHMLSICAEAHALRKGWPLLYSGLYMENEFDKIRANMAATASDVVRQGEAELRRKADNADGIPIAWTQGDDIMMVPANQFMDECMRFIDHHQDDKPAIVDMRDRNRVGFAEYFRYSNKLYIEIRDIIAGIENEVLGRTAIRDRMPDRRPPMIPTNPRASWHKQSAFSVGRAGAIDKGKANFRDQPWDPRVD